MVFIVAIDGPAGAGKSTVSKRVAEQLGMVRVDTGAIYRSVTLASHRLSLPTEAEIVARLPSMNIRFEGDRIMLGDEDVTDAIRTAEVTADVSRVSAMPGVRAGLLAMQRRIGQQCSTGAILDGRDIGTVVFPEANVKIFLTASVDERARRRQKDLDAAGRPVPFEEVRASIARRDRLDTERDVAPLRQAADAIRIVTDGRSESEVAEAIVALIRARQSEASAL